MKKILKTLFDKAKEFYSKEPVIVVNSVVGAIVFLATQFDVILDPLSLVQYVAIALTLIFGTVKARGKVIPVDKVIEQGEKVRPTDEVDVPDGAVA